MTIDEIKRIAEISTTYDLDFPDQMDEYCNKVYEPVKKAVADNDKTVIDFIGSCNERQQYCLATAVEDGTIEGQHPDAIALYKKIWGKNGFRIDNRVMVSTIAV